MANPEDESKAASAPGDPEGEETIELGDLFALEEEGEVALELAEEAEELEDVGLAEEVEGGEVLELEGAEEEIELELLSIEADLAEELEEADGLELLEAIELPEDPEEAAEEGAIEIELAAIEADPELLLSEEPGAEPEPFADLEPAIGADDLRAPEAEIVRAPAFVLVAATGAEPPAPRAPAAPEFPEVDAEALAEAAGQAVRATVEEALAKALDPEKVAALVAREVERAVWEIVPPLAEKLLREAIEKLRNPPDLG